jgi:MFS family permease
MMEVTMPTDVTAANGSEPTLAAPQGAVPVPGLVAPDLRRFLGELAESVEARAARQSRRYRRVAIVGLVLGLLGSLLAAAVAVFGPAMLESLRAQGAKNPSFAWQVPCFVIAVLGAVSTFVLGFQERFQSAEGVAAARECLGKVRALQVAERHRPEKEVLRDLEELAEGHPDAIDPALLAKLRPAG